MSVLYELRRSRDLESSTFVSSERPRNPVVTKTTIVRD